ncbi:ATP-binding protein [Vallitaleaceae bacterium 9-2]
MMNRISIAIKNTFQHFHLSMRRKITFDYLILYFFISLISIVFIPIIFVFNNISGEVEEHSYELSRILLAYNQDVYSLQETEIKMNQLTLSSNVSFRVTGYSDFANNVQEFTIETGAFDSFDFSYDLVRRMKLLTNEKLIVKRLDNQYYRSDQANYTYVIYALYPLTLYQSELVILGFLLIIFHIVGFVMMSMIGGARVKKVLYPIYHMTKAAEEVSISNLKLRLDVEATKYELKDLALTLNDMLDRLDKDYSKQKSFVSDVSHELRTPISIINGYASMLERWGKKDPEIIDESIEAIISESKSMQQLVENLLTLVRSDNQTLQFEFSTFDLAELLCSTVKEFNMLNNKDQRIMCDVPKGLLVTLDEIKIKQTVRIFMDNAIKYTPQKGEISLHAYTHGQNVHIHIKDSGIGIEKEALPYLFERFYRSDESRTRQTGGHGLGLSIAKVIILGHKGKIRVKSALGKGSEFILVLPLHVNP